MYPDQLTGPPSYSLRSEQLGLLSAVYNGPGYPKYSVGLLHVIFMTRRLFAGTLRLLGIITTPKSASFKLCGVHLARWMTAWELFPVR